MKNFFRFFYLNINLFIKSAALQKYLLFIARQHLFYMIPLSNAKQESKVFLCKIDKCIKDESI